MVFYGFHGVVPAEQEVGQRFVVDVEVEKDLTVPGASDDIRDTLNYSRLYRAAKEIIEGPSRNLLENLAAAVAERVLEYEVDSVRVKVKKPEVPIKGSVLSHAAVEVFRTKP